MHRCSATIEDQSIEVKRLTNRRSKTKAQVTWHILKTLKNLYPEFPRWDSLASLQACYDYKKTELHYKEIQENQWKIVDFQGFELPNRSQNPLKIALKNDMHPKKVPRRA